jgi:hypothetical protein
LSPKLGSLAPQFVELLWKLDVDCLFFEKSPKEEISVSIDYVSRIQEPEKLQESDNSSMRVFTLENPQRW